VILADLTSSLVEHFNWKWMFVVLSGLTFNLCACAMVMIPISAKNMFKQIILEPQLWGKLLKGIL
jgi:predicted MFS family arabinose efflux permease